MPRVRRNERLYIHTREQELWSKSQTKNMSAKPTGLIFDWDIENRVNSVVDRCVSSEEVGDLFYALCTVATTPP